MRQVPDSLDLDEPAVAAADVPVSVAPGGAGAVDRDRDKELRYLPDVGADESASRELPGKRDPRPQRRGLARCDATLSDLDWKLHWPRECWPTGADTGASRLAIRGAEIDPDRRQAALSRRRRLQLAARPFSAGGP